MVDEEVVAHLKYELRDEESVWIVDCYYKGGTVLERNKRYVSNLINTMGIIEDDYAEYLVREKAHYDVMDLDLPEAGADLVLQLKKYGGPYFQ